MLLSIIIAAYNVEQYIEKCVLSCFEQDIPQHDYEIIVVNDGSNDKTSTILETLQSSVSNLKIIHQENIGLGASRNRGLNQAQGEFIWFIDGDDYIERNCLSSIANKIGKQDLDCLLVNYFIANNEIIKRNNSFDNLIKISNSIISGDIFYKDNCEKSYSFLFLLRKDIFIRNNIFFKERINMQDSEILPKLIFHINRLSFLNECVYYYVQHPNSFTNSSNGQKRYDYFNSIVQVKLSLEEQLSKYNEQPGLQEGIRKKLISLNQVVFSHLIFFKYEKEWMRKIVELLKENDLYPIKHQVTGKMKLVKWLLNMKPYLTNRLINIYRK